MQSKNSFICLAFLHFVFHNDVRNAIMILFVGRNVYEGAENFCF